MVYKTVLFFLSLLLIKIKKIKCTLKQVKEFCGSLQLYACPAAPLLKHI